jgi:ankyrin repeat protein
VEGDTADPLWNAIEHDRADDLRALLRDERKPAYGSGDGWSPLHHAVDAEADCHNQTGRPLDLRLVQPLLDARAHVNAVWTDEHGRRSTPLDIATDYGFTAAVEVLRRAGERSVR